MEDTILLSTSLRHGGIEPFFYFLCLQVQLQEQENETFSISWVGACIYASICVDVVHPCIFLHLHLHLCHLCEPGLSIKTLEFKLHEELEIT